MTRRLLLIRHGQTTYNATGRMQGHLDTELSEVGLSQARAAADLLVDKQITAIVSSDLIRARDTAAVIGEKLGIEVDVDKRLRETHLGDWQGMTSAEVDEQYPGARAIWRHDPTWAPPQGESRVDVATRARPVIDELMRAHPEWDEGAVLVVAHGGAISALTCHLLGLDHHQYGILSGLKNTHWSQLTARPEFDASQPLSPLEFTPENVDRAQWYFDGWNMGGAVVGGAGADV
ncbi:histidine phosphatase family protein [Corynebacterium minutissimum]|uniref:Phosphoglycerate mutase n=1 Tax=Corynebacterium minutissimum TaxID=38301 RepID=A0A376D2C5_9CORY|nr:histidine phosphatase family protein [Corynebacterium minutissimum]QRP61556.1 histidine phosphatase family protein [Corynebacterium minutissimum]STC80267.1 phosphoglycerate mutase [Corynebacterium minutissimum]